LHHDVAFGAGVAVVDVVVEAVDPHDLSAAAWQQLEPSQSEPVEPQSSSVVQPPQPLFGLFFKHMPSRGAGVECPSHRFVVPGVHRP